MPNANSLAFGSESEHDLGSRCLCTLLISSMTTQILEECDIREHGVSGYACRGADGWRVQACQLDAMPSQAVVA